MEAGHNVYYDVLINFNIRFYHGLGYLLRPEVDINDPREVATNVKGQ